MASKLQSGYQKRSASSASPFIQLFSLTIIRFRLAAARRPRPGTFQGPRLKKDCLENGEPKAVVSHIHDPDIPGRLVLYRPGQFDKYVDHAYIVAAVSLILAHICFFFFRGKFPVVVDPIVGDRLRPHQRDGVRFLYNCITGQGGFKGNGAILADEMYGKVN